MWVQQVGLAGRETDLFAQGQDQPVVFNGNRIIRHMGFFHDLMHPGLQ